MLRKFRENLKNKQRGAIMVFFAILVPLFLGAIGLAVDAGFLYMQKAKLQDVADATALAGAGHLKDDNREDQVASAVVAFAGANGYKDKDEAVSSNFHQLADKADASSVTLEENAAWKIAYAIDTGMEDKDAKKGELRDHVRVVILKRVPTFFIRMLFPEQSEVVVKAVAAAEYVKGEEPEPVISGDTPVIMVGSTNIESLQQYKSSNNIRLGKNFNFPIYTASGNIDPTKLPGTGNLYVNEIPQHICKASYDKDKKDFVWNPPINDRRIFYFEHHYPAYADWQYKDDFEKLKEAYDAERRKADAKYLEVKRKFTDETEAMKQDIDAYKRGEGKKRFIGWDDSKGKLSSNIKEEDREIELYMSGTYFDKPTENNTWSNAKGKSYLTNRQLRNVLKVSSLITDKELYIGTTRITFGNIYSIYGGGDGINIAGEENNFNGTIFSPGNLFVGGKKNYFLGDADSSAEVSLLGEHVFLGKWKTFSESTDYKDSQHFDAEGRETNVFVDNCIKMDFYNHQFFYATDDWEISFGPNPSSGSGSGGSSSGSSGSGAAKAHVRLVI